jgi:hypothetical protein
VLSLDCCRGRKWICRWLSQREWEFLSMRLISAFVRSRFIWKTRRSEDSLNWRVNRCWYTSERDYEFREAMKFERAMEDLIKSMIFMKIWGLGETKFLKLMNEVWDFKTKESTARLKLQNLQMFIMMLRQINAPKFRRSIELIRFSSLHHPSTPQTLISSNQKLIFPISFHFLFHHQTNFQ